MRVFLSTLHWDHQQHGMIDAFVKTFGSANACHFDYLQEQRDGWSVEDINDRFVKAAVDFRADFVWTHFQETNVIQADALRRVKQALPNCVITSWMGDCRTSVSPYLASICGAVDLMLISSVGQIPMFIMAGAKEVRYLQIGLDWEEDVVGNPTWTPPFRIPEVVFCGAYYGGLYPGTVDRVAAIRALQGAGIDIGIIGNGWPAGFPVAGTCAVKQQHHVWKRCKVAINTNHFNDIDHYYSDRQIIAMASGTPLVCKYIPGLETEFENGKHCLWYHSEMELVGNVRSLLADPALAQRIGQAGREEVIKNHTWEARIKDLLPDIERLRKVTA